MNHWAFITAAYAVTLAGAVGLAVQSWLAMRAAEAAAEALGRRQ
ncbi:heme exporter protein CcmD [Sphingomonas canadensis]|uniref:Heme exporter protein D n=1 Tax=Sphingomonas canadensis TaxID=1219257 RepID=A0ABW3H3G7_9SPHN|nr:heme exporter protein CcmD [Sphingomonas canadensis]MCW3835542.1 heme exporter protein CcmD [Sphingomonas canadensis]